MRLKVLSHFLFDEEMKRMGLNDGNVENTNNAYISIIGTPECLNYYLDEGDTKHFFNGHTNVLNLDFDDISVNINYNGHIFRAINMEQAEKAVDFIERVANDGVDEITIHCRAGMSRSRAFAEWIYRYCKEHDIDVDYEDRNEYTTILNQGVLRRLNHAYWKKHGMNEYEDGNVDYPNEFKTIDFLEE